MADRVENNIPPCSFGFKACDADRRTGGVIGCLLLDAQQPYKESPKESPFAIDPDKNCQQRFAATHIEQGEQQ